MCARTEAVLAVHAAAQGLRSACLSRLPAGLLQEGRALANLPPAADLERLLAGLAGCEVDADAA
jgi:hypothetical protein